MKKTITILLAIAFVVTGAMSSFGRTKAEELQALQKYLSVINTRMAKAHKAKQTTAENKLFAIRLETIARIKALNAPKVVAPAPTQVIVNPTPVVTVTPPSAKGSAFYANAGLDAGLVGLAGNLDYGLPSDFVQGLKVRIGGNYVSGTNPNGNDSMKAVSAKLGAVMYITPYLPTTGLPFAVYVGGAYLLPLKVNNARTGKWGVEAYVGADYPLSEMGVVNFEVGYSGLKYAADQPALKGIDLKIGYGIIF